MTNIGIKIEKGPYGDSILDSKGNTLFFTERTEEGWEVIGVVETSFGYPTGYRTRKEALESATETAKLYLQERTPIRSKSTKRIEPTGNNIYTKEKKGASYVYDHAGWLVGKIEPYGNGSKLNRIFGYDENNNRFYPLGIVNNRAEALNTFREMYGYTPVKNKSVKLKGYLFKGKEKK